MLPPLVFPRKLKCYLLVITNAAHEHLSKFFKDNYFLFGGNAMSILTIYLDPNLEEIMLKI